MDKSNFKKLALLGLAGGLLISTQTNANENVESNTGSEIFLAAGCGAHGCGGSSNKNTQYTAEADRGTMDQQKGAMQKDMQKSMSHSAKPMSENELMSQLNANGKTKYQSLDAEGKALAQKLASGSCNGNNECKGMSGCKTAKNADCAGKNSCKGTGTALFKDKNEAVKVAAKKMEEKRGKMSAKTTY